MYVICKEGLLRWGKGCQRIEGKRDSHILSKSLLKTCTDGAPTSSCGNLFQKGTTLTAKQFLRRCSRNVGAAILRACPRRPSLVGAWKNASQGIFIKPREILKAEIRSDWSLLRCREARPRILRRSSYRRCLSPKTILVARCWRRSRRSISRLW